MKDGYEKQSRQQKRDVKDGYDKQSRQQKHDVKDGYEKQSETLGFLDFVANEGTGIIIPRKGLCTPKLIV